MADVEQVAFARKDPSLEPFDPCVARANDGEPVLGIRTGHLAAMDHLTGRRIEAIDYDSAVEEGQTPDAAIPEEDNDSEMSEEVERTLRGIAGLSTDGAGEEPQKPLSAAILMEDPFLC